MVDRKGLVKALFLNLQELSTPKLTSSPDFIGVVMKHKELDFIGKIRDPIHTSIPITALEQKIIDEPEFQRLRRIQQTAFLKFVFPGANHSRFEHSLGAMHVAQKVFSALVQNQVQLLKREKSYNNKSEDITHPSILATEEAIFLFQNNVYPLQCVRVASLLHDIGHSPLSHSGEMLMPSWETLFESTTFRNLPEFLQQGLLKKCNGKVKRKVKHEVYTLMLTYRVLNKIFKDELPHFAQDVCSLIDDSIAPSPVSPINSYGLQGILHAIVSGEIDADRMDYLLRDSMQSGVIYGLFDLERLLDSLFFYYNEKTLSMCIGLKKSGLAAFEDFLKARWSMYQQVYFHRTATACEAALCFVFKNTPEMSLPIDLDAYLKIDDWTFLQFATDSIQKSNHSKQKFIKDTLVGLINERKIWKILYEENLSKQPGLTNQSVSPLIVAELEREDVPCSHIESSTNLTKFSPLRRDKETDNTFMILSYNSFGPLQLIPIENESKLINTLDQDIAIGRIFTSPIKINGEDVDIDVVRRKVNQMIYR